MSNDQLSGKVDQIKGNVKKAVGEAVGNESLANEGAADHVKGDAKETWGKAKDAMKDGASTASQDAKNVRDKVVNKADELKDRANAKIDEKSRH